MIEFDESLFLTTFEDFEDTLVPIYNREREEKNLPELSQDEKINMFLELRKKYAM